MRIFLGVEKEHILAYARLATPAAKGFLHFAMLMNQRIYVTGSYGQPIVAPNFNRLLLDSGHAKLENFTNNEFDPLDWRSRTQTGFSNRGRAAAGPWGGTCGRISQKICFPWLQKSAGKELDTAAKEGWNWLKAQIGI